MNYLWKSSFITNIWIFVLGMWLAFLVFSQIWSPITASIQDAFLIQSGVNYNNADILRSHSHNTTSLTSLKNFDNLSGAVLRVSFLYNNKLGYHIVNKITSSYWFSSVNTDHILTMSLVLWEKLDKDNELLLFNRDKDISSKDVPIIESILLFHDNEQDQLISYSKDNTQSH